MPRSCISSRSRSASLAHPPVPFRARTEGGSNEGSKPARVPLPSPTSDSNLGRRIRLSALGMQSPRRHLRRVSSEIPTVAAIRPSPSLLRAKARSSVCANAPRSPSNITNSSRICLIFRTLVMYGLIVERDFPLACKWLLKFRRNTSNPSPISLATTSSSPSPSASIHLRSTASRFEVSCTRRLISSFRSAYVGSRTAWGPSLSSTRSCSPNAAARCSATFKSPVSALAT